MALPVVDSCPECGSRTEEIDHHLIVCEECGAVRYGRKTIYP